ncbi:MAG: hypothetical protein AAF480_05245, partial [Actinomycetota bacterium]
MSATTLESSRAIALIAKREMRSRLLSKAFVVGLVTTVALIIGIFALGSIFGGDDPVRIGLVGQQPAGAVESIETVAELTETEVELIEFDSRAAAEGALNDSGVDGVVVNGTELVMVQTDNDVVALTTPAWQQAALVQGLGDAG